MAQVKKVHDPHCNPAYGHLQGVSVKNVTVDCPLCRATSINLGLNIGDDEAYNTCMWCCYPLSGGYVRHPGRVNATWLYTEAVFAELPRDVETAVWAAGRKYRGR